MTIELKPCPFCGSTPELKPKNLEHHPVACPTEWCPMHFIWPDIKIWNTRT